MGALIGILGHARVRVGREVDRGPIAFLSVSLREGRHHQPPVLPRPPRQHQVRAKLTRTRGFRLTARLQQQAERQHTDLDSRFAPEALVVSLRRSEREPLRCRLLLARRRGGDDGQRRRPPRRAVGLGRALDVG
eukprot:6192292-Prymnesium_polylepis.3